MPETGSQKSEGHGHKIPLIGFKSGKIANPCAAYAKGDKDEGDNAARGSQYGACYATHCPPAPLFWRLSGYFRLNSLWLHGNFLRY
tara:strand:+ start:347 stop:604 length:258 start_codon:yes stop_codon:yes gene_type:complete